MLTHDLSTNSCCDNLVEMEPAYRTKSNLNKNLFNQKESGYSSHSIVQCMENFVDAVHEMDDTILVPSRLMDLKVDTSKPEFTGGCSRASSSLVALLSTLPDLFTLYTMVRALKNQLQWGGGREPYEEGPTATAMAAAGVAGGALLAMAAPHFLGAPMLSKGHARRPSTASMSSTNSASSASSSSVMSEPDSEASSVENDSGIDAELEAACSAKCISAVELIEQNFQRHLRGLADTLNQLTEAARYVTKRYQRDVLGVE